MSGEENLSATDWDTRFRVENYDPAAYFGYQPPQWQAPAERHDNGDPVTGTEAEHQELTITDRPPEAVDSGARDYVYDPASQDSDLVWVEGTDPETGEWVEPEETHYEHEGEVWTPRGVDEQAYHVWDPTSRNIEVFWRWVSNMSNEATYEHSTYWRRVNTILGAASDTLRARGEALASTWQGEAANAFLKQIGGTLYSLDEWSDLTSDSAWRLSLLGDTIGSAQDRLGRLYNYYWATVELFHGWWLSPAMEDWRDHVGMDGRMPIYNPQRLDWDPGDGQSVDVSRIIPFDRLEQVEPGDVIADAGLDGEVVLVEGREEIQRVYHDKAADIIQELGDSYVNANYYGFAEGREFQGPPGINPALREIPGIVAANVDRIREEFAGIGALDGSGMGPGAMPAMPALPAGLTAPMADLPIDNPALGTLPFSTPQLGNQVMPTLDGGLLAGAPATTMPGTGQLPGLGTNPGLSGGPGSLPGFGVVPGNGAFPGVGVGPGIGPAPGQGTVPATVQQQRAAAEAALQRALQAVQAAQTGGVPPAAAGAGPALPGFTDTGLPSAAGLPGAGMPGAAVPGAFQPGTGLSGVPQSLPEPGAVSLPGATAATAASAGLAGASASGLMMPPPPPPMVPPIAPTQGRQQPQATPLGAMPPPPSPLFVPPGRVSQSGRTPTAPRRIQPTLAGATGRAARTAGLQGAQASQRSEPGRTERARRPEAVTVPGQHDQELWKVEKPKGLLQGAPPAEPARQGKAIGSTG
jgi:hypothetical protein